MSDPTVERTRALAAILAETGVGEIEIADGTLRIRVTAHGAGQGATLYADPAVPPPLPILTDNPAQPAEPAGSAIRAPMHGVFHRAPGPGAPPFVEVGSAVAPGQTVGILEAMKVFNAVLAAEAGVVSAFGAEDGQDVAAGDVLLTLVPSGA